jgi:hypothetical protein
MPLPDFVTHYTRGEPFRSITANGPARWAAVVASLDEANCRCVGRFADPNYLQRRAAVERRMHEAFVARGGAPRIAHPHYAIFGADPRWLGPSDRACSIPLASIPPGCMSLTVGDSLLTWDPDYRAQVEARDGPSHPLTGKLLLPHEARDDLPRLEVQLWYQPEGW